MAYNASDEKQVIDREKTVKAERMQELEDIKNILATPAGMRFFKRFFIDGMLFTTTYTGNSQGYFNEGRRAFALEYFGDVAEASPDKIAKLMIVTKEDQDG